jgi:hypothetical protein
MVHEAPPSPDCLRRYNVPSHFGRLNACNCLIFGSPRSVRAAVRSAPRVTLLDGHSLCSSCHALFEFDFRYNNRVALKLHDAIRRATGLPATSACLAKLGNPAGTDPAKSVQNYWIRLAWVLFQCDKNGILMECQDQKTLWRQ